MTTYSSVLACKIPWTEEPGGLQSMGSQRVGYDPSDFPQYSIIGKHTVLLPRGKEFSLG